MKTLYSELKKLVVETLLEEALYEILISYFCSCKENVLMTSLVLLGLT